MDNENKDTLPDNRQSSNSGFQPPANISSSAKNADKDEIPFEESFKQTVEKLRPYIKKLWCARKRFLRFNIAIFILALLYLILFAKPYFDSTVTILPDYGTNMSMLSQLSGLASLAGVSVGQSSPAMVYQELVTCESVLTPVIYAKYKTEEYTDSVNLIQYFEIKPDKSLPVGLQERDKFLKLFNDLTKTKIKTDFDKISQILTIDVQMPESKLSADVVNNITKSLDSYIQTQLQTNASIQRKYIGKRMSEVKDSLTFAENKLKDFNEQNRIIGQSPGLLLEQTRMQRGIDILNTAYLQLMQQFELAKIQEVKDTPVLNIEEFAKEPIIKTGPKRLIMLIAILFFSAIFSAGYYCMDDKIKEYISYTGFDFSKIRRKKNRKQS